jgi:hypothetical protein
MFEELLPRLAEIELGRRGDPSEIELRERHQTLPVRVRAHLSPGR